MAALCAKAGDLLTAPDPGEALFTWLGAVGAHAVANRGLGASLMRGGDGWRTSGPLGLLNDLGF